MTAFSILRHAVEMIFRDRQNSLRLFVPLWVVTAGMPFFMINAFGVSMWGETSLPADASQVLPILLGLLSQAVLTAGIVIAWHRFVLLDEVPGPVWPRVSLAILGIYVLKGAGLFFLLMLLLLLVSIPAFMLGGSASAIIAVLLMIGVPAMLALSVLYFRWSLILPAAAVGRTLTMRQAREVTEGQGMLLLFLILLYFVFSFAVGLAFGAVQGMLGAFGTVPVPLALALDGGMNAFLVLVWASILTTLYGVFVEGRELG